MAEPRTHYQVSFTSRQAVAVFVFALLALAGAYFLGIATGISGRPGGEVLARTAASVEPSPAPTPAPEKPSAPAASLAPTPSTARADSRSPAPAAVAREPSSSGSIQFFEDRPEEPTPAAAPGKAAGKAAAPASEGFWIQVLSTSSEAEAGSHRKRLAGRGYRVTVSTASSPGGSTFYRVRVGPYASREEAARAADELVRKERVKTWIVSPGQ